MTRRLRGITVVGIVCFLIGWAITWPMFSTWPGTADSVSSPAAKTGTTIVYDSYAILLVSDYDDPQPAVEAVWLAHVPSDYSTIDLAGQSPARFRDQFSHALNGVPLMTLQPYLRGQLIGTITFDRSDVKELVDRLGGLQVLGQQVDGTALLTYLDSARPEPVTDLLMRQAAVIQSLLAEMASLGSQLDVAGLMQTPSHCSVEQTKLYELILHYYPVRLDLIDVHPDIDAAGHGE